MPPRLSLSSVGVHPTRAHIPAAILSQSVLRDAKFASSNRNPGNLSRVKTRLSPHILTGSCLKVFPLAAFDIAAILPEKTAGSVLFQPTYDSVRGDPPPSIYWEKF